VTDTHGSACHIRKEWPNTHTHTYEHTHTHKKKKKDKKTKRSEWSEKGRGKIMEKGGGEGA